MSDIPNGCVSTTPPARPQDASLDGLASASTPTPGGATFGRGPPKTGQRWPGRVRQGGWPDDWALLVVIGLGLAFGWALVRLQALLDIVVDVVFAALSGCVRAIIDSFKS